ncbi:Murein DD-endopeptidase MepM and murein hydrolase activator NlpD, contain LysM domain [Yoonia rosea]|uniref:Murein DD-endopeptidase MepM and murein hydrolase activator NlpD, contain LysM domain n=1 Tax=Yoonia rosea TaxID=287098 RepID=A0A1R3WEP1_9RHOB|nr:M23 family metallopeptidase [Yoonia rosea]SIT76415.1 Murein DD-endopeptidase MepM and murein hydrolase activator NlpD, contain LysM domain [Yoonia rosea]
MANRNYPVRRIALTGMTLAALAACDGFDADLRDIGNGFDTSAAVQSLPGRPRPDDRGVISYPNYQVVVARRDDTIRGIAIRLGLDADELAEYNGIGPDVILRRDEIIALPSRVTEPSPATGAIGTGPIQPLDVTAVATTALDRADAAGTVTATPIAPAATTPAAPVVRGTEPIRHQVQRGETVFSISRLYNVPVTNIAEWNGLNTEFTIREGQYLLIPQGGSAPAPAAASAAVTAPGVGTATPVPPSAALPLPSETPAAPVAAAAAPATPDLGTTTAQPASSAARFIMPIQGSIIRDYAPGTNEGIDIGASAGSDVRAAGSGTVAAVTTDTSGGAIVVLKHSDGLLTVYTQMDNLSVSKDDSVSRGQVIGKVRAANPSFLHFEVRRGLQSLDPNDFLQ